MPPKPLRRKNPLEDAQKSNLGNFVEEVRSMFSAPKAFANADAAAKLAEERKKRRKQGM